MTKKKGVCIHRAQNDNVVELRMSKDPQMFGSLHNLILPGF